MLLRHATPRRNLPSIRRRGLLLARSKTRRPAVWLHSAGRSSWATLHTVRRHGGKAENVAVIEVNVPRGWLRRSRLGLWQCTRDIPPDRFRRVIDFAELSAGQ
jgi:hypothetical protein